MKSLFTFLFAILFTTFSIAQTTILGTVSDGEVLIGATVSLSQNDLLIESMTTGLDGSFRFENVTAGEYIVIVNYVGYITAQKKITTTDKDDIITLEIQMSEVAILDEIVEIVEYKVPLISMDVTTSGA
ncbi:MAG: carboxypeptidase regulatory-like domain-containing protein, partial [Saprospiraceae bacterium]